VRDGAWTEWSEDGRLLVQGHYVHGERDGVWEEWYPNGQLRMKGTYHAGVPDADAQYWDEEGNARLPVTTGSTVPVDHDTGLLSERERPPDPRLAWAFRPEQGGSPDPPVEVRDMVVFGAGSYLYGLRVNQPEKGWELESPEPISKVPPAVESDEVLAWTRAGQLLVVDPLRASGTWSLHRLEADLSVTPVVADPLVLFVGRDNRLHAYDRRAQRLLWSVPVDGEALHVGLAPERGWVLSTTGLLSVYSLTDGTLVQTADFRGENGRPRWTSRPRKGFLLYWWRGDTLEAVRPLDGQVAWTWTAPDVLDPEDARIARVSTRYGDLGVYFGNHVFYLDSTGSGALEAHAETYAEAPPAEYSSCVSWGKVCVRADPDGRIDYPGGRPYLGAHLAGPPSLGADRLWVATEEGWVGRLDFQPSADVKITEITPGKVDEDRFLLDIPGGSNVPVRKVRWTRKREGGPPWERLAVDFGEHLPVGHEAEARLELPAGGPKGAGAPAFSVPWTVVGRSTHQEAWYRYRLYREVTALDLKDLLASQLSQILACHDKERVEANGSLRLRGTTNPEARPEFDTRLEGTFRLGAVLFAKACGIVVSYQDPVTGQFANLGAFGPPGRPLATTQRVRLELPGALEPQPLGHTGEPVEPPDLKGATAARLIEESGFGPSRQFEVDKPRGVTIAGERWVLRGGDGKTVEVSLPELAIDTHKHGHDGYTFEVVTWRLRSAPLAQGTSPVVPIYTIGGPKPEDGVAAARPGESTAPEHH